MDNPYSNPLSSAMAVDAVANYKRQSRATVMIPQGPAEQMYEKLVRSIAEFERRLNETQEVGAQLVNFGPNAIHIENVGFWGDHMVKFYGRTDDGRPVELLQHYSQVSVLLVAVPSQSSQPARRIGFELVSKLKKES